MGKNEAKKKKLLSLLYLPFPVLILFLAFGVFPSDRCIPRGTNETSSMGFKYKQPIVYGGTSPSQKKKNQDSLE